MNVNFYIIEYQLYLLVKALCKYFSNLSCNGVEVNTETPCFDENACYKQETVIFHKQLNS